jgi:hypothetical protein
MIRTLALTAMLAALGACSNPFQPTWEYERVDDKLRDVTNVTATLRSNDGRIVEINRRVGEADSGYFPWFVGCGPENPVYLRLDDGPIETLSCVTGDVSIPVLDEPTIRRIETADTMVVEFQQNGKRTQTTFNVRGLRL